MAASLAITPLPSLFLACFNDIQSGMHIIFLRFIGDTGLYSFGPELGVPKYGQQRA
jgi:hypothetical protein